MKEQRRIIRGILLVIIIITSYYVLRAGYNAFVAYRNTARIAEAFAAKPAQPGNKGTCTDIEYAQINDVCTFDLLGPAGMKPTTPQLKKVNKLFAGLPFKFPQLSAAGAARVSPVLANTALLRLLSYVNERRLSTTMIRFRNMVKCLFFTCSSSVKMVVDMSPIIEAGQPIFTGSRAAKAPIEPSTDPAKDLELVLSYLDTRMTHLDERPFFKLLRDHFMDDATSALRTDIPFGRLAQLVNPTRIFENP